MSIKETWIDLFDKLPDEVLEVILNNLTCNKDLTNLTKCSSICSSILHPQKPTFLFHEVIQSLASSSYLNKADLLTCRLVSREWKSSIDNYLENCEKFNDENYFRRNSPFWPRRSRSITDFLNTMQFHYSSSPKINPFPGRRSAFGRIRREAPDFDYWVNVIRLLEKFGSELRDCRLDFEDIPFERFVSVLNECLMSLPNLKRLLIVYFGRPSMVSPLTTSTLNYNIFPELVQLEHLELNGTFPSVFYHSVVLRKYSRNLKVLKLHQIVPEDVYLVSMPLLEVLRASVSCTQDLWRVLPRDSNALREISLSMYLSNENDFTQLFEHLHVYRNTLKTLEISFDTVVGGNITTLNHPFIQTFPILSDLKLKNAPVQLLDSLESFPCVEHLEFECLEKGDIFPPQPIIEQEQTCGVFKICGYPANQLYSSKIWSVLPCLMECRLSCYQLFSGRELKYRYSRARYEYLQRKCMC